MALMKLRPKPLRQVSLHDSRINPEVHEDASPSHALDDREVQGRLSGRSSHAAVLCTPSPAEVFRRLRPPWELEREAPLGEDAGYDTTALQDQLGLRPHEDSTKLEHPFGRGQPKRDTPRVAEATHERSVRQGVGRCDIDRTVHLMVVDQPVDRADEVDFVDPRHILPSVTCLAT